VLVLYLSEVGLGTGQIAVILTATLLGDVAVSLWITTTADRTGRRRMLVASGLLMVFAAATFAVTVSFWLLLLAATVGIVSLSGGEVGPFMPIEQAALSQAVPADRRTAVFAWYNLAGSVATALGALAGGLVTEIARDAGLTGAAAYRPLLLVYGATGALLVLLFTRLSAACEAPRQD